MSTPSKTTQLLSTSRKKKVVKKKVVKKKVTKKSSFMSHWKKVNEIQTRRPFDVPSDVWSKMGPLQRFNLSSGVISYDPDTGRTYRTDLRAKRGPQRPSNRNSNIRKKIVGKSSKTVIKKKSIRKKVTKKTRRVDWLKSIVNEKLVMTSGEGSFQFDDGSKYTGQLKNGVFHGIGIRVWEDGTIFNGDWKDGVIQGHGRIIYPSGVEYIGSWKDGVKSGRGTLFRKNGTMFTGDWEDGLVKKPLTSRWVFLDGEFVKITERPQGLPVVKKKPVKKKKKTTKKKVSSVKPQKRVGNSDWLISTLGLHQRFVDKLKVRGITTLIHLTLYSPLGLIKLCGLSAKIDLDQLDKVRKHLTKFGLRMKKSKLLEEKVDIGILSSSERRRLGGPDFTVQFDKSGVYIGRKKS